MEPKHIILSRTDSIGDVMLTLPMAGVLKEHFPDCKVTFLGRSYTKAIINCCAHVDAFVNWDEIEKDAVAGLQRLEADTIIHVFPRKEIAKAAKVAGIERRIGTSHRTFHLLTCNYRPNFTRKNSDLHEGQLNLKLLEPLGIGTEYSLVQLQQLSGFSVGAEISKGTEQLLKPDKKNIILHPRSKGSAREWGLDNFEELISLLPEERYQVFITGTKEEGELVGKGMAVDQPNCTDVSGRFSLDELIGFINGTDALIAASTGPLHIAAALNKAVIGLYSPMRPIHPGRWGPLGAKAKALVHDPDCASCSTGKECDCIQHIAPSQVKTELESLLGITNKQ